MGLIIALLCLGLFLLLIEIYLTPGASIFGLAGIVFIIWANIVAFKTLVFPWFWVVLVVSFIITILFLAFLFKMLSSKNFAVKSEINDKTNVLQKEFFYIGQKGKTTTDLRPGGRAIFDDKIFEVYSQGDYVDVDTLVEVIRITDDKLFVKPVS